MKISVAIRKTIQEDPYEPFSIELSLEKMLPDATKEKLILIKQDELSLLLQESIESILKERKRNR